MKRGLGLKESQEEAPRSIVPDDSPCEKCLKFAEDGYVTIRAMILPESEVVARGLLTSRGQLDVKGNLRKIYELLHPMVWRAKVDWFNERMDDSVDTDKSRFVFLSIEAVEMLGLPTDAPSDGIIRDFATGEEFSRTTNPTSNENEEAENHFDIPSDAGQGDRLSSPSTSQEEEDGI